MHKNTCAMLLFTAKKEPKRMHVDESWYTPKIIHKSIEHRILRMEDDLFYEFIKRTVSGTPQSIQKDLYNLYEELAEYGIYSKQIRLLLIQISRYATTLIECDNNLYSEISYRKLYKYLETTVNERILAQNNLSKIQYTTLLNDILFFCETNTETFLPFHMMIVGIRNVHIKTSYLLLLDGFIGNIHDAQINSICDTIYTQIQSLKHVEDRMIAILQKAGIVPVCKSGSEIIERITVSCPSEESKLKSSAVQSFFKFNEKFLFDNHLTIMGGRTGVGKTSMSLSIVYQALSSNANLVVLFFTLGDMDESDIIRRLLSIHYETPQYELHKICGIAEESKSYGSIFTRIFIQSEQMSYDDVDKCCTYFKEQHPSRDIFVVVDYLQRVRTQGADAYAKSCGIQSLLDVLKKHIGRNSIHVLCTAQLSRTADSRIKDGDAPQLSDISDSVHIENYADTVLLLYKTAKKNGTVLSIAKNRHGNSSIYYDLAFDDRTASYKDVIK